MISKQQSSDLNGYFNSSPSSASAIPLRNTVATAIDAERAKSSLTFKEVVAPGLTVEVELRRILAGPVQSKYQKVEILDTYFGKVRTGSVLDVFVSLCNACLMSQLVVNLAI